MKDCQNKTRTGVNLLTARTVSKAECSWKSLTTVPLSAMNVQTCRGGDLHLQLFTLGGVCRHGVAVVGPQAALTLGPHWLRQLIGRIWAGASAARPRNLPIGQTSLNHPCTWQINAPKCMCVKLCMCKTSMKADLISKHIRELMEPLTVSDLDQSHCITVHSKSVTLPKLLIYCGGKRIFFLLWVFMPIYKSIDRLQGHKMLIFYQ